MDTKFLRRQVLLSTTMLVAALSGYGRRAYGACLPAPAPLFECSGAETTQQNINFDDAEVVTLATPAFSVVTADPRAVSITGDGALSYTDEYASTLTGASRGLSISSYGDVVAGNPGSVTVDTNGNLTGATFGLFAENFGSGAVTVNADGNVTSSNGIGILAENRGTGLSVTTGASTLVTGRFYGIAAGNFGGGALSVTVNGDVTGTERHGIRALNSGTDLTVTTGVGTVVTGYYYGVYASNSGGVLSVVADGNISGTEYAGIHAENFGTDLSVTSGVGTTVTGGNYGIEARNFGSGALTVTANGDVEGTNNIGIYTLNYGTDLDVTTGADSTVTGIYAGIFSRNKGSGALTVAADGDVEGTNNTGIYARNYNSGTDLSVTTGAYTTVTGGTYGISALNYGSGALTVTTYGDVTGTSVTGIYARNLGTNLDVTTGADTMVTGSSFGIRALNLGSGALSVTANGDVEGTNGVGIFARNDYSGTDLDVTTATGTAVTGGTYGIRARNDGSGALTITANGNVTGTNNAGIYARNNAAGTDLYVTTGAGTIVTGGYEGINAFNFGTGALSVTANGDVTGGTSYAGIFAYNSGNGTDLDVSTGAGTEVTGGSYGITALNYGSGALTVTSDGDVTGISSVSAGIYSRNSIDGTILSVTTGINSTVTGGAVGIQGRNLGSGALTVIANGDVTGTSASSTGVFARNYGTDLDVTTVAGTAVTGGSFGIEARNDGTGALSVIANGDVEGTNSSGILARNSAAGTALTLTTGADTEVTGGNNGIYAYNNGSGELTVTANGDVTGTLGTGIYARNDTGVDAYGMSLAITTGADTTVTGGNYGIRARNYGTGDLTVTANGDVTGTNLYGIQARNGFTSGDIEIITGADTTVTGGNRGVEARNYSGSLTITADGDVTGTNADGIFARNSGNGTDVSVTTGTSTSVTGLSRGIDARNYGTGALTVTANGDVTGTLGDGIYAMSNNVSPVIMTVGSASAVTSNGGGFAIRTENGPSDVTVAGTLNGGTGGAAQFDQMDAFNDRFALETTAIINGNAFGGLGTDTLALQGTGLGSFDAGQLVDFESGEKTGTSTWTLTGTNTQITGFAVNDGVLFVNGSLANAAFVVNAGTLGGTGTIGALTVLGDAVFAPGNSIGTITADGNLLFNAGAIYEVEVNAAGQGDQTIVFGTVNLTNSVLRVLAENGTYNPSTDYVIIDNDGADAVTGTFGTVTSNLAFLTPSVIYNGGDGNDVVLTLAQNAIDFCAVAQTPNQCNVAEALEQFPTDNPLFLAVLNQTVAGARQAFDALSGEIHATVPGVLADDSRYLREAVLGRLVQATYTNDTVRLASLGAGGPQLASLDSSAMALGYDNKSFAPQTAPSLAFWTRAYGAWGDFDGNKNAASAERDLGGIVSGLDARLSGTWRVGFATGYSQSNVSVAARHSAADVESFHLAGYSGGMAGPVALRGGGAWSWNEVDTSRAVIFPGFFEREKADYDADTGQIFGEAAYPIVIGRSALEPFAGLAYVSIDSGKFMENGTLAGLRGSGDDLDVGYSTLGLRAAATMAWNSVKVTPHMSAAWQHAFDDVTTGAALAFASTGIGFTITGVPLAEDTALIEAGLALTLSPTTTLDVSYAGQFGDDVEDNAVQGRFAWRF